jgi:hypothetical protein
MERFFQVLAAILAGIAAYFLWTGNGDSAFVSGVLGAVSFFLSVRFQVKERNRIREEAAEEEYRRELLAEGYLFDEEIPLES